MPRAPEDLRPGTRFAVLGLEEGGGDRCPEAQERASDEPLGPPEERGRAPGCCGCGGVSPRRVGGREASESVSRGGAAEEAVEFVEKLRRRKGGTEELSSRMLPGGAWAPGNPSFGRGGGDLIRNIENL